MSVAVRGFVAELFHASFFLSLQYRLMACGFGHRRAVVPAVVREFELLLDTRALYMVGIKSFLGSSFLTDQFADNADERRDPLV
jgi:hypothetical protein